MVGDSSVFRGGHAAMTPLPSCILLKMQEMPFQRPKFQNNFLGAYPRTALKLCRHYGIPLTKILATPLVNTH